MLFAIDIGNSNIVMAILDDKKIINTLRIFTDKNKTPDEYWLLVTGFLNQIGIKKESIEGVIISSVVNPVLRRIKETFINRLQIEPLIVNVDMDIGIRILYENPRELGIDRLVNAVGGYEEHGGPLLIVDFGTATTYDVVDENGNFIGGAIAPGIGISIYALSEKAPALPKVDITIPEKAIGKNTISNMQSGFYYGFLGQTEEIIRRIKLELPKEPKVIATGGLAKTIAVHSKLINLVEPDLTIKGLQVIYSRLAK